MEPVRWGVLGIGRHFIRRVVTPANAAPEVDLYAVASRSRDKARSTAEQFGIPVHYGAYEELLDDAAVEAVFITVPNHLHLEWIKKAADAGKHILCEKPLTLTAAEAREAADYAAECRVMLMEAFMYRFHPQWVRVRELVMTGHIGDIRAIHTVFSYTNTDPRNIRNIRAYGGGGLYDIGCYAVSVARWVFDREPSRVVSLINRDPDFDTDVLSSGLMDFGAGHATFTVGTKHTAAQSVDIQGTSGGIRVHIPFNTYEDVPAAMTVVTSVGSREVLTGPADHYGLEFAAVSRAIRDGGPMPIPPWDAIRNMAVLDALFASELSGRWVTVAAPE